MGFDTQDLLRETGLTEGDTIPLTTLECRPDQLTSTSSDTFTLASSMGEYRLLWDNFAADSLSTLVAMSGNVNPNGDAISIRFRNKADNETAISKTITGSGFQNFEIQPTDYVPTTTSDITNFHVETSNNDNTTSVSITEVVVYILGEL